MIDLWTEELISSRFCDCQKFKFNFNFFPTSESEVSVIYNLFIFELPSCELFFFTKFGKVHCYCYCGYRHVAGIALDNFLNICIFRTSLPASELFRCKHFALRLDLKEERDTELQMSLSKDIRYLGPWLHTENFLALVLQKGKLKAWPILVL